TREVGWPPTGKATVPGTTRARRLCRDFKRIGRNANYHDARALRRGRIREARPMNRPELPAEVLDALQRKTFDYFIHEVNALNGLVMDRTEEGAPASIAVVGLALAAYPVGVERGFITREAAIERTLATLHFFRDSVQGNGPDATGYK